jgi:hypothetical protein
MRLSILRSSLALMLLFGTVPWASAAAQDTAGVSGRVTDNSGAPLAGADVALRGPASYATRTDAAGAFSVGSMLPGIYSVTVRKAGYATATDDVALIAGSSQNIVVGLA